MACSSQKGRSVRRVGRFRSGRCSEAGDGTTSSVRAAADGASSGRGARSRRGLRPVRGSRGGRATRSRRDGRAARPVRSTGAAVRCEARDQAQPGCGQRGGARERQQDPPSGSPPSFRRADAWSSPARWSSRASDDRERDRAERRDDHARRPRAGRARPPRESARARRSRPAASAPPRPRPPARSPRTPASPIASASASGDRAGRDATTVSRYQGANRLTSSPAAAAAAKARRPCI